MEQKNQKSDEKKQKITEKKEKPEEKIEDKKNEQIKKPETQNSPRDTQGGHKNLQAGDLGKPKKIKKDKAVVNIQNAPVSTKYSMGICKFIKNKKIEKAINELGQVLVFKKAIPMEGEVGHKKSAGSSASGSGKYPQDAARYFIKLLKSLSSNAIVNGLENPVIVEAIANIGQKPRARFGRWKRKRTHLRLVAKELIKKTLNKKENKKQGEKTK